MIRNDIKKYNIRIRKMLTKAAKAQVSYPDFVQSKIYFPTIPLTGFVFNPYTYKDLISFDLVNSDFVLNCLYSVKAFGEFRFEKEVKYYFLAYISIKYDQSVTILARPISRDFYLFSRGYWNLFRRVMDIGYNIDEKVQWDKAFDDIEKCISHNIIGKDLTKAHYWIGGNNE